MAIFTNNNKQFDAANINGATIIAAGTKLKGELKSKCHIHIDGEFDGEINSENSVLIGKNGNVIGNISAQRVIVSGKFNGSIDSEFIEILSNGRVDGTIVCDELCIEKKGVFVGDSKLKTKKADVSEDKENNEG